MHPEFLGTGAEAQFTEGGGSDFFAWVRKGYRFRGDIFSVSGEVVLCLADCDAMQSNKQISKQTGGQSSRNEGEGN